jgi:hypothetical protein
VAETWAEHNNHLFWKTTVDTEDGRIEEEITKNFKEERLT